MKEIVVTASYLGINQDIKNCQNEEPLLNCTTKKYYDAYLNSCGCIPISIRLTGKVFTTWYDINTTQHLTNNVNFFKEPFCSPEGQKCLEEIKVNTSSCLKPCSGLIVTSLSKSEKAKDVETFYPILIKPYNIYKKITRAPTDGLQNENSLREGLKKCGNLSLFLSYTLPILHSSNLTLFTSHTLTL